MKADARAIDQLVQDWWLRSPGSDELLQRILERTLPAVPGNLVPFARAMQVLETYGNQFPAALQRRVAELGQRLATLRDREHQVDALGDLDNEPQVLFTILGDDEVAGLQGFDPQKIHRVRLSHTESRAACARAFLEEVGWDRFPTQTATDLRVAVDDLADREGYETWGLFVDRARNQGLALGVKVIAGHPNENRLWSGADKEIEEQAGIALRFGLGGDGWEARIEWPANYVGESIGLPFYIAARVARGNLPHAALTASTGRLDIGGEVKGVTGIAEKIAAARRIGIRRVLVPRENLEEARAAAATDLIVLPVAHIREADGAFRQSASAIDLGYAALVRLVRTALRDYDLLTENETEEEHGHRFAVANARGSANVWVYKNGRVYADGRAGPVLDAANRLIAERVPSEPVQKETFSFQLPTRELQDRYQEALLELGAATEAPHEHEGWRLRLTRGQSRVTVVLYKKGSCVIQGTAPAWDHAYGVAQGITQAIGGLPPSKTRSRSGSPDQNSSALDSDIRPHIGTDEAGKGDYFGPLVSAAVYVDRETAAKFRQLGVRDSKTLSDRRARELANEIRRLVDGRYAVVAINPRRFNSLYEQFRREKKNLNSLLGWGHGRSIDQLLAVLAGKRLSAEYVLVDQFADSHYIEERTRRAGIPIDQRHRAEADIAVAAASILARDGFLLWLEQWSQRTEIALPKGASPQVVRAAKEFVRRWGANWLGEVAKLNFRTTREVLEGEDAHSDAPSPHWVNEGTESES